MFRLLRERERVLKSYMADSLDGRDLSYPYFDMARVEWYSVVMNR